MGFFRNDEKLSKKDAIRRELMGLNEKELLIEILLELKELNKQSGKIKRNQMLWGN